MLVETDGADANIVYSKFHIVRLLTRKANKSRMGYKSLVGKRYGSLVITKSLGGGVVEVKCDCGMIFRIERLRITRRNGLRTCGCGAISSSE